MAKSDVHAGNFFILQNVSNDMCARCVGADGEFATRLLFSSVLV